MNEIVFETADGEQLIIATTRPELLPACCAVFFHPDDARYAQYLGGNACAISPIFGVEVPLIPDADVEIGKGTGLVMCCTFGDVTDIEWWRKYKLPTRVIISSEGLISLKAQSPDSFPFLKDQHPGQLTDLINQIEKRPMKEARAMILDALKVQNLLLNQKPMSHAVKCAERSKAPVEFLVNQQWFIKVLDQKEQIRDASNQCRWYPEFMRHRMDAWIDGLKWDWCISRQRFFGVPFPVWYSKRQGEEGKVLLPSLDQLPVDPSVDLPKGYARDEVTPDMDVMDTWATSSVSPQINSHAISENFALDLDRHRKLFPADLRPQSHEIIRTWTFCTIVKAMMHEQQIPWHNIMISGWVLDADRKKISKSAENSMQSPMDLSEEKGADVVRYWACCSRLGHDVTFSEKAFKEGRKLVTKLWNAAKLIHGAMEKDLKEGQSFPKHHEMFGELPQGTLITCGLDRWLLSRLHLTIKKATEEFENFEYCSAREAIESFFWSDFCYNYLELVKGRLRSDDQEGKRSALQTLIFALKNLLKLFAPFLPDITEELNDLVFGQGGGSIHARGTWPLQERTAEFYNEVDEKSGHVAICMLNLARKFKSERKASLKEPLSWIRVTQGDGETLSILRCCRADLLLDLQNATYADAIHIGPLDASAAEGCAEPLSEKVGTGSITVTMCLKEQHDGKDVSKD